jgi:hypothetical protein
MTLPAGAKLGSHEVIRLLGVSSQGALYNNLWATRFDPDRRQPIGKPFALTHFDSHAGHLAIDLHV